MFGNEILSALVKASANEKVRALAQFNRVSGAAIGLLGYVDPITLNNEHYKYLEVEANIGVDILTGTYDNYRIYDPNDEENPVVYEGVLDVQAQAKILKEYPLGTQLNVLRKLMREMVDALGVKVEDVPALEAFREMDGYIEEVLANNKARKEYMTASEDFTYITDAESAEQMEAALDGGLHEVYGARFNELVPGV